MKEVGIVGVLDYYTTLIENGALLLSYDLAANIQLDSTTMGNSSSEKAMGEIFLSFPPDGGSRAKARWKLSYQKGGSLVVNQGSALLNEIHFGGKFIFQLLPSSGTITGGTMKLYGIK